MKTEIAPILLQIKRTGLPLCSVGVCTFLQTTGFIRRVPNPEGPVLMYELTLDGLELLAWAQSQ